MKQNATYKTLSKNSIIVRGGVVCGYISTGYKDNPCFSSFEEASFYVFIPTLGNA